MSKILIALSLALSLTLSSCANYEAGDISTRYCNETDPVTKAALKTLLVNNGVVLPVDYCLAKILIIGE